MLCTHTVPDQFSWNGPKAPMTMAKHPKDRIRVKTTVLPWLFDRSGWSHYPRPRLWKFRAVRPQPLKLTVTRHCLPLMHLPLEALGVRVPGPNGPSKGTSNGPKCCVSCIIQPPSTAWNTIELPLGSLMVVSGTAIHQDPDLFCRPLGTGICGRRPGEYPTAVGGEPTAVGRWPTAVGRQQTAVWWVADGGWWDTDG